jgi:hypothetical protein
MGTRCGAMVAALALALPARASGPDLVLDTPEFSIRLPAGAERTEQKVDTAAGPVTVVMYLADYGDRAVVFSWVDYPDSFAQLPPDRLLDGARDGAITNSKATLTRDEPLSLVDGSTRWPGRLVEGVRPPDFVSRAKIYLVRARLYQFLVAFKQGSTPGPEVEAMLASFKLKSGR